MAKARFTKEQVIGAVRAHQAGVAAAAICRHHGISPTMFDRWWARYAGTQPMSLAPVSLAEENQRLKARLAEALLRVTALEDQISGQ